LPSGLVSELAARALAEDVGGGDATTAAVIPSGLTGRAVILAGEPLVVAGLAAAEAVFHCLDPELLVSPVVGDGSRVAAGDAIVTIRGNCAAILTAERTALNFLQRLSGIATRAARAAEVVADLPVTLLDTRKTTPGLRLLEKAAIRAGGVANHRNGLDDGILIKDNHVACAGTPVEACRRARAAARGGLQVEVEIDRIDDLEGVVEAGADIVLLDNFSCEEVAQAVRRAGSRVLLEASGGINLDNLRSYAATGVQRISLGFLTHSSPAVDLSMELEPDHDD
jgi:nicotinate-nucleotide pyrophosphorylase (carboxylating)